MPFLFKDLVDSLGVGAPPTLETALLATPLAMVIGCTFGPLQHCSLPHAALLVEAHCATHEIVDAVTARRKDDGPCVVPSCRSLRC